MLTELFVEVMLFVDRDSLDSMQLACRFMLDYVQEHEANDLARRRIWNVSLGDVRSVGGLNPDGEEHWLPVLRLFRLNGEHDQELYVTCVHDLLPYLRLAYCETVDVTLEVIQSASVTSYEVACGMLFDGLNARSTDVDSLTVCSDQGTVDLLNRSINAFKSVGQVCMKATSDELIEPEAFNEAFFASLAHRGIEHFDSVLDFNQGRALEVDAATALAYLFAEPTNGVSRELSGLYYKIEKDLLKLVRKKAGELDSRQRVDLKATMSHGFLDHIDPAGFETYEEGESKCVADDLDNGLKLEIEKNIEDRTVVIRVYSST